MPTFSIIRKVSPEKTFRVAAVMGMFDLESEHIKETFQGNIPIEKEKWQIGCIVGNSGTGKSVIAKELFKAEYIYEQKYGDGSILDDMPKDVSVKEIVGMFNSVGFSSPPSWLKPYAVLSEGEKMRVNLAKAFLSDSQLIVFDEFTSVVDRNIAKVGSFAVAKAVRRSNKQFIAVSCHSDILEWLEPDWVFDTNIMKFQKKNSKDQKYLYQLTNVAGSIGKCLGNITI